MSATKLLKYMAAEAEAAKRWEKDGSFHADTCCCWECKAIRDWFDLSWLQRLLAKFSL